MQPNHFMHCGNIIYYHIKLPKTFRINSSNSELNTSNSVVQSFVLPLCGSRTCFQQLDITTS